MPTISYRLVPVTPKSWYDRGASNAVPGVLSASVSRSIGSGATTLESASFSILGAIGDIPSEGWFRLEALLLDGASRMFPIATMRLSPTSFSISGGKVTYSLQGKSVLQPLADHKIRKGDYISKGANAAAKIGQLIREATPAPVSISGSFTLNEYYVLDPGASYLEAVWGTLDKAGWCMQISPDGVITVCPKPTKPRLTIDRNNKSLLKAGLSGSYSMADIPNRLTVLDWYGDTYTVVNNSPESRVSTKTRGWYVDAYDSSPQLKDGETIASYAKRRLAELSVWTEPYSYTRDWIVGNEPRLFDIVRATIPTDGMDGDLRITAQQVDCSGTSLLVDETGELEHKEYTA